MKQVALSIKLTIASLLISALILALLYFGFTLIIKQHLLKVEREKAELIVQTIEPMIAISAYLGLSDEILQLAQQVKTNPQVVGVKIILKEEVILGDEFQTDEGTVTIIRPINDPLTRDAMGSIEIAYTTEAYKVAASEINNNVLYQLAFIALAFLLFGLLVRYLLRPLEAIAKTVSHYKPGESINFSSIRMEPEIYAIANAFDRMLESINEHNLLLERYKLSMDESSIVSKMDPEGKFTYVNDAFCRASGYNQSELMNRPCDMLQGPDTSDEIYKDIWHYLQASQIWKGTLKNRTKSGDDYFAKTTIVPILDEQGILLEYITIQQDVTKIVRQQEQITRQTTDTDTGLYNRIKLIEDLKATEIACLAIITVDNYDVIKDYYGYETGLNTLINVSRLLKSQVEDSKYTLYKLVSNEFGLLASGDGNLEDFHLFCRRIIDELEESPLTIGGEKFDIHATAGISNTHDRLILYASLALDQARKTNVPAVVYELSGNLILQYENNIVWTKKIKQALNDDRIVLFVQAIVDIKTRKTAKYECLVRMIDTDGSIISPFHFLEVAKKSKLYHKITQVVINKTIDALMQTTDIEFSINLSPDDLLHDETMVLLKDKLQSSNIANRVVLEIVESEEIETFNDVCKNINELKRFGCKVAIDDFGTGYSNFSYLMQLNADFIKVDGSLVKNIDKDANSRIISETIIQFARQLDLQTVAEFVHNESVESEAITLGFDFLQGFHLAEPMPIENLLGKHG